MLLTIDGSVYVPATDLLHSLGISRTTLWRWRRAGKVPQGYFHRDQYLLFTEAEAEEIRRFANRVEPAPAGRQGQLRLFGNGK